MAVIAQGLRGGGPGPCRRNNSRRAVLPSALICGELRRTKVTEGSLLYAELLVHPGDLSSLRGWAGDR